LFSDLPPEADLTADIVDVSQVPQADSCRSLDHLVGAQEDRLWDCQAERFCGLEIYDEIEVGRLLYWKFARLSIALRNDITTEISSPP
jgi:hypothetical protein